MVLNTDFKKNYRVISNGGYVQKEILIPLYGQKQFRNTSLCIKKKKMFLFEINKKI